MKALGGLGLPGGPLQSGWWRSRRGLGLGIAEIKTACQLTSQEELAAISDREAFGQPFPNLLQARDLVPMVVAQVAVAPSGAYLWDHLFPIAEILRLDPEAGRRFPDLEPETFHQDSRPSIPRDLRRL
jgi:hypothetical protein